MVVVGTPMGMIIEGDMEVDMITEGTGKRRSTGI
jgi:hypothetical protein